MTDRCAFCDAPLPLQSKTGRASRVDKVYCSAICRANSTHVLIVAAREEEKIGRKCDHCGKAIPQERRLSSLYCSERCCHKANLERGMIARRDARRGRSCVGCGAEIPEGRISLSTYCSLKCRGKAERARAKVPRVCATCGCQFHGMPRQMNCSISCAAKSRRARVRLRLTAARLDALLCRGT